MKGKGIRIVEDVIIFLSIFSMWPVIFRWPGKGYKFIMYISLFLLVIILINRCRRLHLLRGEIKKKNDKNSPN